MTRCAMSPGDLRRMAAFGCRLPATPKHLLTRSRGEHNRRLIREAGLPLEGHRISDDGLLAAYEALKQRENGGG